MKKHATDTPLQVILIVFGLFAAGFMLFSTFTTLTKPSENELRMREGSEKVNAALQELERVRQKNQTNQ